jgi:hypothetical protein
MNPREGLEKIVKPSLAKVLGDVVTNLAMGKAYGALVRMAGEKDDRNRFSAAVGALCEDANLKKALGPKRLDEMRHGWLSLFC